jgi:hypothetical protein
MVYTEPSAARREAVEVSGGAYIQRSVILS